MISRAARQEPQPFESFERGARRPVERVGVFAANGKTGRAVGAALQDAGLAVTPIASADWERLPERLRGCDAAYLIAPNLYPDEPAYVTRALEAMTAAGVSRVVYHSVASPYAPSMPHHRGKAVGEDLVRRSGLAWTVLQPGAYLQNLDLTETVRVPYRVDAPFGFADLREVARAAAVVLTGDGHAGATYELASLTASVAQLADGAGVGSERIDFVPGPELTEQQADWLAAMFGYYDRHGLPVGTAPLRALLR